MAIEDQVAVAIATEIGKQVPVKQAYDDVGSPAARQVGYTLEDLAKAARLFTLPVQWLAVQQDRFRAFIERSAQQVPEQRRMVPAPQLLGPILEATKYDIHDTPVTEMYEALLARAMDKDRVHEASPAFVGILSSLSGDEARLLRHLHREPLASEWQRGPIHILVDGKINFKNADYIVPAHLLDHADGLEFYIDHLVSKGIVSRTTDFLDETEPAGDWRNAVFLMRFGQRLMEACTRQA